MEPKESRIECFVIWKYRYFAETFQWMEDNVDKIAKGMEIVKF